MLGLFFIAAFAAFATWGDECSARSTSLEGYTWDVIRWEAGCVRQCYYHFNVSGPAFDQNIKVPAFLASCDGYKEDEPFLPCIMISPVDNPSFGVSARLERANPGARITVSYRFPDPNQSETYYNFTGSGTTFFNAFSAPRQNFTITPTDLVGVA